ncbi:hypothetical protein C2S53_019872 [Perilla frutescens var. hirtella]|uniref:Uncharacterized protein n=1 Tax=Perilla frutescens var. hirtella TaxID=608512 RepID=A0AAD4P1E6_PERFH|nr:hypothetical protein C2S53_019872 [Perilla frutescens var. hirtella]
MYVKMELVDKIREVLQHFGGEETIQTFRSGCLGHFVDFRGGNIARKALHALICREVRVQDPAREGRECWFHMTTPRLLRWSFIAPSIDFSRFFDRQMDVQPMVPSAAELLTPYVQSLDGDSLLGVRYVVPRKVSKKKLLTGVARRVVPGTCKGISDVVNPAPQRRSARTAQQQAPQTTHRLIDEPDEGSGPSEQGPDRSESPPRPTEIPSFCSKEDLLT